MNPEIYDVYRNLGWTANGKLCKYEDGKIIEVEEK